MRFHAIVANIVSYRMRQSIGCIFGRAILILPVILLGGCGMLGESASSALVAPGKFEYHNCAQLAEVARGLRAREQELVELMERAGQSPAGEIIGAVAYRTELVQARGQLTQIAEVGARKNCASESKRASDRALW